MLAHQNAAHDAFLPVAGDDQKKAVQNQVAVTDWFEAAGLTACGIPYDLDRSVYLASRDPNDGAQQTRFLFAPKSVIMRNPGGEPYQYDTRVLLQLIRSGKLEELDPDHPALAAIQGAKNLHHLQLQAKTAQRMVLLRHPKAAHRFAVVTEQNFEKGQNAMTRISKFFKTGS
jgi:hypothetical protein